MDTFEVLPEFFDPLTGNSINIDNLEIGNDFWNVGKIPANFSLPSGTTIDVQQLLKWMDDVERPYVSVRKMLRDDGVCEFLEAEIGEGNVQNMKARMLKSKTPPLAISSFFITPKSTISYKGKSGKKKPNNQKPKTGRKSGRKPKKVKSEPMIVEDAIPMIVEPVPMIVEDTVFEVEYIVEHNGDWNHIEQMWFKVHWLGYSDADDTWEPYGNLDGCSAILEEYRAEQTGSLYLLPLIE